MELADKINNTLVINESVKNKKLCAIQFSLFETGWGFLAFAKKVATTSATDGAIQEKVFG